MADESFFAAPTIASIKKHHIVSKYFGGWANIVLPKTASKEGKLMYVDLYAGPGKYGDGTPSIPLLVLQHAIATPSLHNTLQTVFNDENPRFTAQLQQHVAALPGIELLHYKPIIRNRSIGPDIIPLIGKIKVPTLFFADPWGYQGVSIDLISAALSHWGSDFLFFFNYNRINMNLGCEMMQGPIDEFFTPARAARLRQSIATLRPDKREHAILGEMKQAIKELRAKAEYFTYRSDTGTRPTHHLLCVSRHQQGIALFKEISAKESSRFDDDVPSLDHNPAAEPSQGILFSPLAQLEDELVIDFAGKRLTTEQIYHAHHNGKPYILKNYRQALLHLEEAGIVTVQPTREERRSPDTFPPTALVTFRKRQAS